MFERNLHSVRRLLVTANVVPSPPILVALMMEALRSSETLVPTSTIRRNNPEDGILHSHSSENLISYIQLAFITTWFPDFVHRPDFHKPENTTFRKLDVFPSSGEGRGHLLYKNQKLTLPQAMSDQKEVNHSKQGDYKHLTVGRVHGM
jgi:hypothetical protein